MTAAVSTGATIVWVRARIQTAATRKSVIPTTSQAVPPRSRSQRGAAKSPLRSCGWSSAPVAPSPPSRGGRGLDRRIAPPFVHAPAAREAPGGCRRDGACRLDEGQVAERLREVAELPPVLDVVFLGEQPEVVAQR